MSDKEPKKKPKPEKKPEESPPPLGVHVTDGIAGKDKPGGA